MGRLGTMVDWSEVPVARGANESGVQPVLDARVAEIEAPESTRPFARAELPLPPAAPSLSDTRLQALLAWLVDDAAAATVVTFVRGMLGRLAEVDAAVGRLARTAGALSSEEARASAQSFAHAAQAWRANLVDYVDELALTEHTSLAGWSSVPEYSTMLLLAYVAPALASLREHGARAWAEGIDLELPLGKVEVAIERLDVALACVRRSTLRPAPLPNVVAW